MPEAFWRMVSNLKFGLASSGTDMQGTLAPERIARLDGVHGWVWNSAGRPLGRRLRPPTPICRARGTRPCAVAFVDDDGYSLGTWAAHQRVPDKKGGSSRSSARLRRSRSGRGVHEWTYGKRVSTVYAVSSSGRGDANVPAAFVDDDDTPSGGGCTKRGLGTPAGNFWPAEQSVSKHYRAGSGSCNVEKPRGQQARPGWPRGSVLRCTVARARRCLSLSIRSNCRRDGCLATKSALVDSSSVTWRVRIAWAVTVQAAARSRSEGFTEPPFVSAMSAQLYTTTLSCPLQTARVPVGHRPDLPKLSRPCQTKRVAAN